MASAAATKRNYKDNGEYDLYNQAFKDAQNPAAQIKDLETWAQKYPDSDYKDVRTGMLVQAYSMLNPPQPAKVLDLAAQLMSKDLRTVFDDPQDGKRQTVSFLFATPFAAGSAGSAALPNPTPAQVELGRTAAKRLKDEAKAYFVPANKPAATSRRGLEQDPRQPGRHRRSHAPGADDLPGRSGHGARTPEFPPSARTSPNRPTGRR